MEWLGFGLVGALMIFIGAIGYESDNIRDRNISYSDSFAITNPAELEPSSIPWVSGQH